MALLQSIIRAAWNFHEQRRSLREPVDFPAWIDRGPTLGLHDCTVVDVSDGGARIIVASSERLPKEFWLILSRNGGRRRKCRIVWRSGGEIGVAYLTPLTCDGSLPPLQ